MDDHVSKAVACTTEQTLLGEGARWDARRDELLRVDILAGRVYRDRIADDGGVIPVRTYDVGGTVSAIAPIDGDDGWLLAADRGFAHLSSDGSVRRLADVAPPGTRMNDGACDPKGRFWAGTLADRAGAAALYRLDRCGRTEQMLDGLTTSNGLDWSPDGRSMYLADSGPHVVHAFDFDADAGTIANGRVIIDLADELGTPDGLTVDADGDLWVAIWERDASADTPRMGPCGRSSPCQRRKARAARSRGRGCIGCTSPRRPRTSATNSAEPIQRRGSCTGSRRRRPAGRRHHSVRTLGWARDHRL